MKPTIISLLFAIVFAPAVHAGGALAAFSRLNHAGLVVVDGSGRTLTGDNADTPLIPASTTKLATAWLALSRWGEDYRFETRFYLDKASKTLWVKGSGDPFLVSEELDRISRNLKEQGLTSINAIGVDTSLFQQGLVLPGTGTSDNPYDAVPTAVAANFNTINVRKIGGQVLSAEAATPLTPYAESFGRSLHGGELRVNTGPDPRHAEQYFAELLAAFLHKYGVHVGTQIISGKVPVQDLLYRHANSKPLGEMVRNMLKYSTNFIANQLILTLSAEHFGRPANQADVQRYMESELGKHFGWRNFALADGAGLSRSNRLSPRQLTELLQAFGRWKQLLPEVEPGIYAKTGTLTDVSTLAGYLVKGDEWQPFAVMMNQNVPYHLRNQVAKELARE